MNHVARMVEFATGAVKTARQTRARKCEGLMLHKLRILLRRQARKATAAASRPPVYASVPQSPSSTTSANTAGGGLAAEMIPSGPAAPRTRVNRTKRTLSIVSNLRGDMRTLESKIDAIQSRSDRLAQSVQAVAPVDAIDLAPVTADLAELRRQVSDLEAQQGNAKSVLERVESLTQDLHSEHESLTTRVQKQTDRVTESDERIAELARRIEEVQLVLQSTLETVHNTRDELSARESARSREIAGRIVGLYVISCIALTVAIATLIIVLSRVAL